ncbi:hypothetical protein EUTSA_v100219091mg, partial [Eutrema salsugineum]
YDGWSTWMEDSFPTCFSKVFFLASEASVSRFPGTLSCSDFP